MTASPGGATRSGSTSPHGFASSALADLAVLRDSPDWGWLEIWRPRPTAAFSRRDTLAAGYPRARDAASEQGFEPVVRPAGGRLAAYHEGALSLTVVGRHPTPAAEVDRRFRAFGEAITAGLRRLGVDARLGQVPGEYCPGRYSVNAGGRSKLAGTAQRMTAGSFLLAAVVMVSDPEPVRSVLARAYPLLDLPLDPGTVGCVADHALGTTADEVQAVLLEALGGLLPMGPVAGAPLGDVLRVPLTACWTPG